jgi:hypothetical protein
MLGIFKELSQHRVRADFSKILRASLFNKSNEPNLFVEPDPSRWPIPLISTQSLTKNENYYTCTALTLKSSIYIDNLTKLNKIKTE